MKKINENTKVTLTFEQLKKLVKESYDFRSEQQKLDDMVDHLRVLTNSCELRIEQMEKSSSKYDRKEYLDRLIPDIEKLLEGAKELDAALTQSQKQVKEDIDAADDEGPADVDAAIEDLFDMYRACKVEPKVCNAIKADGEKTNIFLGRGNSVGGIAKALRDGRLLKVIGFK